MVCASNDESEVYVVGDSFGESGILAELEFGGYSTSKPTINMRRIAGVPLSLEILTQSKELLAKGVSSVFSDSSTSNSVQPKKKHSQKSIDTPVDFPAVVFRSISKVYVIEIENKLLQKMLAKNKPRQKAITEQLRRFNGFPNDGRWLALLRNAPLMKLLTTQLAVREFLENLSDDYVTYQEGTVLEDGRSTVAPKSVYFVKEGVLRITPMHNTFSFRATGATKMPGYNENRRFECARGSLIGDFNAMIKNEKSPYRIVCMDECEVYHLQLKQLHKFFEEFPGIKFQLIDRVILGWMLDLKTPSAQGQESFDEFGGLIVDDSKPF